jgi:serine/threonine-protein kinase HipA
MVKTLSVRLHGEPVGILTQEDTGRLTFAYLPGRRDNPEAGAISMSMPPGGGPFEDAIARPFLAGYLPDDYETRDIIGRIHGVSGNSDFALLAEIGRDCAGAVSVHPPDEAVILDADRPGAYEPLSETALETLIRDLPRRPLFAGERNVRLSLAGAQDKAAVYIEDGEIYLPQGGYPSTHIVKPAIARFEDTIANEHFAMRLARRLGLNAAETEIRKAGDTPFLLIERYDRTRTERGTIRRRHQEDFCQALAVPPTRRYEADGGPTLMQCFELIDRLSRPAQDRMAFLNAIVFNLLIGNTDAHAKNFSILYENGAAGLAPLYDLSCSAVYAELTDRLAMRIGGKYKAEDIMPRHWQRFAGETDLSFPLIRERLREFSEGVVPAAYEEKAAFGNEGIAAPIIERIVGAVETRANGVRRSFEWSEINGR